MRVGTNVLFVRLGHSILDSDLIVKVHNGPHILALDGVIAVEEGSLEARDDDFSDLLGCEVKGADGFVQLEDRVGVADEPVVCA